MERLSLNITKAFHLIEKPKNHYILSSVIHLSSSMSYSGEIFTKKKKKKLKSNFTITNYKI